MRINCLDNLDRTNVLMSRVALSVLKTQLTETGLYLSQTLDAPNPCIMIRQFAEMWADNADWLSRHYTGTDSTMSAGTRASGGYRLTSILSSSLNSVKRFVNGVTD
jgi:hypothetical protein